MICCFECFLPSTQSRSTLTMIQFMRSQKASFHIQRLNSSEVLVCTKLKPISFNQSCPVTVVHAWEFFFVACCCSDVDVTNQNQWALEMKKIIIDTLCSNRSGRKSLLDYSNCQIFNRYTMTTTRTQFSILSSDQLIESSAPALHERLSSKLNTNQNQ